MTADTLPDEVDFVFCPEALPEEEVHRIVLVVEGMGGVIPTSLVTLTTREATGEPRSSRAAAPTKSSPNTLIY